MKKSREIINWTPPFQVACFLVYNFTILILAVVLPLVYRFRVKGRSHLRGHHRGILTANHCQYIEPGMSALAIFPKQTWFSAEEHNVIRKDVGWLIRLLRSFGIPEDRPLAIIDSVKKILQRNFFVLFYPEGVLSWRNQEPRPFLEGAFFFAFLNNVPVFPVTEVLKERPIRKILPWWPPRTLFVIGEPLYPEEFRRRGMSRRQSVQQMSNQVRQVMVETIEREGGCLTLPERRLP